jgi:hypothetical protein
MCVKVKSPEKAASSPPVESAEITTRISSKGIFAGGGIGMGLVHPRWAAAKKMIRDIITFFI